MDAKSLKSSKVLGFTVGTRRTTSLRFFLRTPHATSLLPLQACLPKEHFTHYATAEEAEKKWHERFDRLNKDNIFIFLEERDGLTKDEMLAIGELNVKGIVVFTANEYPDIPYALYLPKYHDDGEVGNILSRKYLDDSREYEQYFDFVKWFNEANGKDYEIKPFVK